MRLNRLQQYVSPQHVDLDVKQFNGPRVIETIYGGIATFGPFGNIDNSLKAPKGTLVREDLMIYIPDQDLGVRRYPAPNQILGVVAIASIASWSGDSGEDQKVMALDDVFTELWEVLLGGVAAPGDRANFLYLRIPIAIMSGILQRLSYHVTVLTNNVDTPGNKIHLGDQGWDGIDMPLRPLARFPS
jgi:hypothetical protein